MLAIDLKVKVSTFLIPAAGFLKGKVKQLHVKANSDWFWQTGWNLDTVKDAERIRDYNLMAAFGYWSFVKNESARSNEFKNHKIWRCDYVNGKRESSASR